MKIAVDKINECAAKYIREYLLRKATEKGVLFKLGVLIGSPRAAAIVTAKNLNSLRELGIVDENGDVDVEFLRKAIESGMQAAGDLRIDELGVNLETADVNAFFQLLETGKLP